MTLRLDDGGVYCGHFLGRRKFFFVEATVPKVSGISFQANSSRTVHWKRKSERGANIWRALFLSQKEIHPRSSRIAIQGAQLTRYNPTQSHRGRRSSNFFSSSTTARNSVDFSSFSRQETRHELCKQPEYGLRRNFDVELRIAPKLKLLVG